MPEWATAQTDYFIYYVCHEVCHALRGPHDEIFKKFERQACAHFGIELKHEKGGCGPYIDKLIAGGRVVYWKDGKKHNFKVG